MKITVNIPTSLREVTLKQYQSFEASKKTNADTISIFLKGDSEDIRQLPANVINSLSEDISKLFATENVFYNKIKIGGQMFGFIPSLNDMTYGEYIDIIDNIGDWQTMHNAMAVLYRPIITSKGKDYVIEEHHGTAKYSDVMLNMPLDVALGAVFFLTNLQTILLRDTLSSAIQNLTTEQQTDLLKSGITTTQLFSSLHHLGWSSKGLQIIN